MDKDTKILDEDNDINYIDDIEETSAQEDHHSKLKEMITQMEDKCIRTIAELENVRKRAQREIDDASKYAVTNFARDILHISDSLHMALQNGGSDDIQSLLQGVQITRDELQSVLQRFGIEEINPIGEKFDHHLHQAMFEHDDDTHPSGTVISVLQKGYMIHKRLLRPALVGVSK